MAIATALHIGVVLLTDVGISQSIVVHREGDSASFLDTAWVLQIIKGLGVAALLAMGSGWAADFYDDQQLQPMVLAIAAAALVGGFNSTKLATADRQMQARQRFFLDMGSQTVHIVVMILLAKLTLSPMSLAWGSLAGAVCTCVLSHSYLTGRVNRLHLDLSYVPHILSFGAMIMLSSALTFAMGEGSRLLLGALIDLRMLGIVGIAMALSSMATAAIQTLSGRVLFPAYAQVHRDADRLTVYRVVGKGRNTQAIAIWGAALFFVIFGQWIVTQLYDPRYASAGLVLQVLALGNLIGALTVSYSGVLTAIGRPAVNLVVVAVQALAIWLCVYFGNYFFGTTGAVMGIAVASWLCYPFIAVLYARLGFWYPRFDIPVLLLSTMVALVYGYWQRDALGL